MQYKHQQLTSFLYYVNESVVKIFIDHDKYFILKSLLLYFLKFFSRISRICSDSEKLLEEHKFSKHLDPYSPSF